MLAFVKTGNNLHEKFRWLFQVSPCNMTYGIMLAWVSLLLQHSHPSETTLLSIFLYCLCTMGSGCFQAQISLTWRLSWHLQWWSNQTYDTNAQTVWNMQLSTHRLAAVYIYTYISLFIALSYVLLQSMNCRNKQSRLIESNCDL